MIVDDFRVEYVGKKHADHFATILKKYYNITKYWGRKKYAGIDLKWNHDKRTCRATMDGYISDLRNKYGHLQPKKPQYSPHNHRPIAYGAKQQIVHPTYTSPALDDKGIKRVQGIFGVLLYVVRSVNNKILVALITIGAQQAAATEEKADAIEQLLEYVATYPDDGTLFRKNDMILSAHAYAVFINK